MPSLPHRHAPAPLLGALLGALLAACGGGAAEAPGPPVRPLELTADGPPRAEPAEPQVVTLRPPAGLAPWTVEANRFELAPPPDTEGPDGLYLYGREAKAVQIPGPFEAEAFNQVAVTLRILSHTRVQLALVRGGRVVEASGPLQVWSTDAPQRVVALFPRLARAGQAVDALRIETPEEIGVVLVEAVELVRRPLAEWLPAPGDAPELLTVGGDQRAACVVDVRTALTAEARVGRGDALAFSYALPEEPRLPGAAPVLVVTVDSDAGPTVTRLPLEEDPGAPPRWRGARLALDAHAGRAAGVRFALETTGDAEAWALVAEARLVRSAAEPSTVVLVTSDTHRADHLGAARSGVAVSTPAIDALAARGVLFEQALSTSNITIPSHVALLTGVHPRDTRVVDNRTTLVREAATLAEAFRARGYRTFAAISTHHLGDALSGLGQGFERMSVPAGSERPAPETCAEVERWLSDAEGEPLFLWLHLFDAHGPYDPPEPFARPYLESDDAGLGAPARAAERQQRARYRGEVSALDAALGRVLAAPRIARGVVALTADHGECLGGPHGIFWEHAELYPDTIHVPLVLAWPGAPAGARVAAPVAQLRLGRTLLDLAGLADAPFPGQGLLREVEGAAVPEPSFALAFAAQSASITHQGWHLILHLVDHAAGTGADAQPRLKHQVELYDLASDPDCARDLSTDEPERARRLRAALVEWLSSAAPGGLARQGPVDAGMAAHLSGLGYADAGSDGGGPWFEPDGCARCAPFE